MSTKTCATCGETKPVDLFRKAPTRFGGDGRSKSCKACGLIAQRARRAAREGSETQPAADEAEELPPLAQMTLSHSLGFHVELIARDLRITQGAHTVWISLAEFTELVRFVHRIAHLADTPPEPTEEPNP